MYSVNFQFSFFQTQNVMKLFFTGMTSRWIICNKILGHSASQQVLWLILNIFKSLNRNRGPNFCPLVRSRVIRGFAVKCFLCRKVPIFLDQQSGHVKWFCKRKGDSYGIHVVVIFRAYNCEENTGENLENSQFYTKFTKSYICYNFFENRD